MAEKKRNKRDSFEGEGFKNESTFFMSFVRFRSRSLGSEAGWWGQGGQLQLAFSDGAL